MSTVLDTTRTQAFAQQALGIVNGGFLSLMLSVGSWRRRGSRPSRCRESREIR
jgi:hypothetical protein